MNSNPAPKYTEPIVEPLRSVYAGDADMAELIELFVGEMPDRIAMLNDALADNDLEMLAGFAHQIKGAGGGYGFPDITAASRRVEDLARDESSDVDAVRRSVDELVDLCRRASAG